MVQTLLCYPVVSCLSNRIQHEHESASPVHVVHVIRPGAKIKPHRRRVGTIKQQNARRTSSNRQVNKLESLPTLAHARTPRCVHVCLYASE